MNKHHSHILNLPSPGQTRRPGPLARPNGSGVRPPASDSLPGLAAAPSPIDPGSGATRVLCVDDHAVLVEGLKARFAVDGGIEVVGGLPTAARLIEEVRRLRPHVVLLDIEMPGPDAFEMTQRLHQTHPDVKVIVLSAHIRDAYISAAFSAGACGYFAKADELTDIVTGIRTVVGTRLNSFLMGPKVPERCRPVSAVRTPGSRRGGKKHEMHAALGGAPLTLLASLTPRETEILRLIGKGLSRVQIAAQLCRSAKTIDAHQGRMMKKLGIAARADLMRFAIREGLASA